MNNKAKIFEFLYKRSSDSYNINQIARINGISVGSAFKILKEFERLGFVTVTRKNNAMLYNVILSDKTKEFYEKLEEQINEKSKKKTKVICSINSDTDYTTIKRLIEKGMDIASINVSDINEKITINIIQNIRFVSPEIPILLYINDPKFSKWVRFALKNDLDFVAVLAKSASDIIKTNKILGYNNIKQIIGEKIKVIAIIDNRSLRNYREIIFEAYGIIIDRSNLVTSKKLEILPRLQKSIIDESNKLGKPVILSGNILNSMTKKHQPSQSDVYDISNAVLDGVSCIMLSEEKEYVKYPVDYVNTLSKIIKNAESGETYIHKYENGSYDLTHFIGNVVSQLEKILYIDALLVITSGGYSARMISSRRLRCKTLAATARKKIFRQLNLLWGIEPLYVNINAEDISNNDKKEVILKALEKGFIGKRDQIAIIASMFHSKSKRTNMLEIHNVSEFLDYLNKVEGVQ